VLDTFEIDASAPQRGSVIWMHGLGATNHDFDSIVPELGADDLRFVFPAAPERPVTINQGLRMPAWYDILSFDDPPLREDEGHVREVARDIHELIERERERGVPCSSIVVAGFSQGAAMALHVGLRSEQTLAGILVLSGYLVVPNDFDAERSPGNQQTPVLFCHGSFDPIVPVALGRRAHARLLEAGYPARFEEYPMQHSLCIDEVRRIGHWLRQVVPAVPTG
jgi:phospholipase/carboxylesterase